MVRNYFSFYPFHIFIILCQSIMRLIEVCNFSVIKCEKVQGVLIFS